MSNNSLSNSITPGGSFYVVFVTKGTMRPSVADIAKYDAFVSAEARRNPVLAALHTHWRVIGSTPAVAAVNHLAALHAPIYRLDGELVASNGAQLFSGVGRPLINPIQIDQFGRTLTTAVFTGSSSTGQVNANSALGNPSAVTAGSSAVITTEWISSTTPPAVSELSYYGISGLLQLPGNAPMPPRGLGVEG